MARSRRSRARYAPPKPSPQRRLNPHWIGAGAVFVVLSASAGAIQLLGDPNGRAPYFSASLPAPEPEERAPLTGGLALRREAATSEPLDQLAPPPETASDEPTLPGVTDLDAEATPIVTAKVAASLDGPAPAVRPAGLPPAPLDGLHRGGPNGALPVISSDGRRASVAYARPFDNTTGAPMIAVVIAGLGYGAEVTERAIETLPPEVTLAFAPYASNLQGWVDQARSAGHEVLIELPMEPFDYPQTDPGPHTLLSDASAQENQRRLEWLLTRTTGYFGVTNYQGAKLATAEGALERLFSALHGRGLAFVYDGASRRTVLRDAADRSGVVWSQADRILDAAPSANAIDDQLLQLEALAIQNGSAIGKAFGFPISVTQIKDWAETLELKGYTLAPASAVIRAQAPRRAERQEALGGERLASGEVARPVQTAPKGTRFVAGESAFKREQKADGDTDAKSKDKSAH
ncbi:MAG: divergent polysaccharide deacetylase family protein [Maricaulaceae bacterium]